MRHWHRKLVSSLLPLLAIFIVILSIIGGIRSYTPVPTWDMWGPFLSAYKLGEAGGLSDIFSLHNEHRIIIARLFFWVDMYLFNGNTIFLIVINYLLAAIAAWTLFLITRESPFYKEEKTTFSATAFLATSLCFTWMQWENFTWAFQSQFFAAQLIPLIAFFLLYKSTVAPESSTRYFWLACIAGVFSAGAMANGVIALALMAIVSFIFGMRRWQSLVLIALSLVISISYFHNFHTPGNHGSLGKTLLHQPLDSLHYVLLYIGSPAFFMTGKSSAATMAGLFILLSAIFFAIQTFRDRRNDYFIILLLTYLLYIGGSALGTAGGRLVFGLDQALSSRYTTPAIMAWATLAIIYTHYFHSRTNTIIKSIYLILTLSLIPQQLTALRNKEADLHEKLFAALAAELQIHDNKQIQVIFPSADYVLNASQEPSRLNYSVFGDRRIRDAREEIATKAPTQLLGTAKCEGHLDLIQEVDGAPDQLAVHGWIYNYADSSVPSVVRILDKNGIIVGRAVTGAPRSDVAELVSRKARYSGFSGYLSKSAHRGKLTLVSEERGGCHIDGLFQDSVFTARPSYFSAPDRFASTDTIAEQRGWNGHDVDGSRATGYKVLGTFAIQDKLPHNQLTLRLQKGDSIYYRSGGSGFHQISVGGHTDEFKTDLPLAPEWTILKFDQPSLPESFTVTLTDSGTAEGTWSAVALRITNDDPPIRSK